MIQSPSVKIQIIGGKVYLDNSKAKHCRVMSTNFLLSKGCWQSPAMFCLYTSSKLSAHNLNFRWSWRWWDWIQPTFKNLSTLAFRWHCIYGFFWYLCKKQTLLRIKPMLTFSQNFLSLNPLILWIIGCLSTGFEIQNR